MKKKIESLLVEVINPSKIRGGIKRGDKYWDTIAGTPDGDRKDHECPNGNMLIGELI